MSSSVGRREIYTQQQVVSFFRDALDYGYLGHWQDRAGNANIEQPLLEKWLKGRDYSDQLISRVLFELDLAKTRIQEP